ncbi:MAG: hypothetical protein D6696_01055 [Acidobacteria bacterium]|nr:MAG: hypothetical protein D6696_01055 [Acidobacteriota bacterium]
MLAIAARRLALVALVAAAPLGAEEGGSPPAPAERYRLEARRIDAPIVLDGRLDEAAWREAPAASGFTQREPRPGEPASERTEVRIVYTPQTLYVGVHCFDREPHKIVAREMQRDGALFRDDSIIVLLDTFDDDRNAYFFETNANGARTDSLITDESNFNFDWDGVWDAAAQRGEDGWTAEIAIPFSTLRFDPAAKAWGLEFRRLIRRKNEDLFWAPIGIDAGLERVSKYGALYGIEGVDPGLNLNVKPFVVASARDVAGGASEEEGDGGLDVKWGVSRGLALDLTLNTDFAETEVDDQQINLTRFSLFFPEKREFFLENAGIFDFGAELGGGGGAPLLQLFFPRRIGIASGEEVPIDWGVRLTGRQGPWNLGLLDVQTGAVTLSDGEPVPDTNWAALRLNRNLGQRSSVGVIATNRAGGAGDWNRVVGVDLNLKPSDELAVVGFVARSDDAALASGDDFALGIGASWEGAIWDWGAGFTEIGERFEPDLGFLLRRGVRRYSGEVSYEPRPESRRVRNYSFELEAEVITDRDGVTETEEIQLEPFGIRFESEDRFTFFVERNFERLFEPFEIVDGVVIATGGYTFHQYGLRFRTNEGRLLVLSGSFSRGGFFDGDRDRLRLTLQARPSRFLRSETTWERNDVSLPAGSFTTNLVRQRLGLAWSPRTRVDALAQYNDVAELVGVNLRFNWIYKPGADLFVVVNQTWNAPTLSDLTRADTQVIVKFTYLYQR